MKNFIRTLKNEIYKHMTSASKNMCIDKLNDIVNEYNNIYHRAIKMKQVDVKDNSYFNFGKEVIIANILNGVTLIVKKLLKRFMKRNCKTEIKNNLG